jgi:hypothetical protein
VRFFHVFSSLLERYCPFNRPSWDRVQGREMLIEQARR